jgi:hypothetical protein
MKNTNTRRINTAGIILIVGTIISVALILAIPFASIADNNTLQQIQIGGAEEMSHQMLNDYDGEIVESLKIVGENWEIVVDRIVDGEWAVLEVYNRISGEILMIDYKIN